MAPAIEGFYVARDKHLKKHDWFRVERGMARICDFIAPETTPEEYLRRLR